MEQRGATPPSWWGRRLVTPSPRTSTLLWGFGVRTLALRAPRWSGKSGGDSCLKQGVTPAVNAVTSSWVHVYHYVYSQRARDADAAERDVTEAARRAVDLLPHCVSSGVFLYPALHDLQMRGRSMHDPHFRLEQPGRPHDRQTTHEWMNEVYISTQIQYNCKEHNCVDWTERPKKHLHKRYETEETHCTKTKH